MANIDERLLAASKADKQRQEEMSYRDQLRQEKLGSAQETLAGRRMRES